MRCSALLLLAACGAPPPPAPPCAPCECPDPTAEAPAPTQAAVPAPAPPPAVARRSWPAPRALRLRGQAWSFSLLSGSLEADCMERYQDGAATICRGRTGEVVGIGPVLLTGEPFMDITGGVLRGLRVRVAGCSVSEGSRDIGAVLIDTYGLVASADDPTALGRTWEDGTTLTLSPELDDQCMLSLTPGPAAFE